MKPGIYEEGPARLRLSYCSQIAQHLRGNLLELSSLVTDPEWRGKGYATALMWKTVRACDLNKMALLLNVQPFDDEPLDTEALSAWYRRFGFRDLPGSPGVMFRMPYWEAPKPQPTEVAEATRIALA